MNLQDIKQVIKEDLPGIFGLDINDSETSGWKGIAGTFAVGFLVGVGAILFLAPKATDELRQDLGLKHLKFGENHPLKTDGVPKVGEAANHRA